MYVHKAYILDDLKEVICVKIAQVDGAILERVEVNLQERLKTVSMKIDIIRWFLFSTLDFDKC